MYLRDFFTDSTMVDYHEKPPFGIICFVFFSNHLKQIQLYIHTRKLTAMEYGPFEDVFDVFPVENGGYSIAMLVYCRVAGFPYVCRKCRTKCKCIPAMRWCTNMKLHSAWNLSPFRGWSRMRRWSRARNLPTWFGPPAPDEDGIWSFLVGGQILEGCGLGVDVGKI